MPELGDRTPAEAADTPMLDTLAAKGASGWHLPFGWGVATSSERAHWAMFGFADIAFPGRAVLEALGAGVDVPLGVPAVHGALRSSHSDGDRVWLTGRARPDDNVPALLETLAGTAARHHVRLHPLPPLGHGEMLLLLPGLGSAEITDSDPFFENLHPWLQVRATAPAGEATAAALTAFLLDTRAELTGHRLDVLTTKWAGMRRPGPGFREHVGIPGAAVTSTRLYRGLATYLGMQHRHMPPHGELATDLRARVDLAAELIDGGTAFVHLHIKAPDEAGHTKDPYAKRDTLEAIDRGLHGLAQLAERAVIAVTGDHATPSTSSVLHSGDPTPLVVAGPTVRPDKVSRFGEAPAADGDYGIVRARELLPLLLGHANRPAFLGHRPSPHPTLALPVDVEAMPSTTDSRPHRSRDDGAS